MEAKGSLNVSHTEKVMDVIVSAYYLLHPSCMLPALDTIAWIIFGDAQTGVSSLRNFLRFLPRKKNVFLG